MGSGPYIKYLYLYLSRLYSVIFIILWIGSDETELIRASLHSGTPLGKNVLNNVLKLLWAVVLVLASVDDPSKTIEAKFS